MRHRGLASRLPELAAFTLGASVAACESFGSADVRPASDAGTTNAGGSDAGVADASEASSDGPSGRPLWDGACVAGLDSICDPFDNYDLAGRWVVKASADTSLAVAEEVDWSPMATGRSLQANIYPATGIRFAFVEKPVPLGSRFGVAFRFAVGDHPGGGVIGPRIATTDEPEGTLLGLRLSSSTISVQQPDPNAGGVNAIVDLGDLKRQFWHFIVIEVRRDPLALGGFGTVHATLDGAAPVSFPLRSALTNGTLRVGSVSDSVSVGLRIDDLAFFTEN
jgi:hypothetical protein